MMLETLRDEFPNRPLVRLCKFTANEARQLLDVLSDLAAGAVERVEVHTLPFVESVDGCQLTLVRGQRDQGMQPAEGGARFEYGLTAATWDNVAGLVEPFAEGAGGYQWLAGGPGTGGLLLSELGAW